MAKKTTFNNPDSQEREYTRSLLRYSKQLQADVNSVLLPRLPGLKAEYDIDARTDSWVDTLDSLMAELARMALTAMGSVVTKLPGQFNAVSKFNEGQFKLVVKANTGLTLPPVMPGAPASSLLGVNVFRSEPFLKPLAEGWISENTALIKSLPTRLHPELEGIVRRGVMNGASVKDLTEQIKARYGVTDYRAKLIAQDQTLKLNADLTRYRLQSVGVERYIWRSVQDSRVRPEHADRNGNEYTWKEGAGGEHPGQPVRCRCRAEAIWDEKEAAPSSRGVQMPSPALPEFDVESALKGTSRLDLELKNMAEKDLFERYGEGKLFKAIDGYVKQDFRELNSSLRSSGTSALMRDMDEVMARAPTLTEDAILFRGVRDFKGDFNRLRLGDFLEDGGFSSTTTSQTVARGFGRAIGPDGKTNITILRIRARQGTKVLKLGNAAPNKLQEVVLGRGKKFKVVSKESSSYKSAGKVIPIEYIDVEIVE